MTDKQEPLLLRAARLLIRMAPQGIHAGSTSGAWAKKECEDTAAELRAMHERMKDGPKQAD